MVRSPLHDGSAFQRTGVYSPPVTYPLYTQTTTAAQDLWLIYCMNVWEGAVLRIDLWKSTNNFTLLSRLLEYAVQMI